MQTRCLQSVTLEAAVLRPQRKQRTRPSPGADMTWYSRTQSTAPGKPGAPGTQRHRELSKAPHMAAGPETRARKAHRRCRAPSGGQAA